LTDVDLATPEKSAANVLGVMPVLLLMVAFFGGMHLAIDAAAGERERGSLESLLVNPVSRGAVVVGKWLAVTVSAWAALAIALAGFGAALAAVPLQELNLKFQLGAPEMVGLLAAGLPLALLASALQLTLALFARTFKEAQTYLSLLVLIPGLPAMFLALQPIKASVRMMAIPVFGQTLLMTDVLRGEPPPAAWFAIAAAVAVALSAALLAWAARLLRNEKIIFGRAG
jgi:sodium transport system permease protein